MSAEVCLRDSHPRCHDGEAVALFWMLAVGGERCRTAILKVRVCAQVAERLMATGCKPVALRSYGGSNPPLCTMSLKRLAMNRFLVAMGAYVVLAIVAWTKLTEPIPHSDFQVRHVVIVILLALATSTWLHRNDRKRDDIEGGSDQ